MWRIRDAITEILDWPSLHMTIAAIGVMSRGNVMILIYLQRMSYEVTTKIAAPYGSRVFCFMLMFEAMMGCIDAVE